MANPNDWYARWAAYHGAMFGMDNLRDQETFAAWADVFSMLGYGEDDLFEATRFIASSPNAPTWRDGHLAQLKARVQQRRREQRDLAIRQLEARQQKSSADDKWGVCEACRGTGLAVVPHPSHIGGGEWLAPFYTAAVACSCVLGVRAKEAHDSSRMNNPRLPDLIRLTSYSERFPDWKAMMRWKDEVWLAERRSANISRAKDVSLGPLNLLRQERGVAEPESLGASVDRMLPAQSESEPETESDDMPF